MQTLTHTHTHTEQRAVEEAVLKAKQHYEAVVQSMSSQLATNYEAQKSKMSNEIRALELRLASLLQQQQHTESQIREMSNPRSDKPQNSLSVSVSSASQKGTDGEGRVTEGVVLAGKVGGVCETTSSEALKGLLKNTAGDLRKDILLLVRKAHFKYFL